MKRLLFALVAAPSLVGGIGAATTSPFVAGLMAGGAHGLLYPGLAALVTDTAAETRRGVIVAMFSAVFLVGQTAGSFAFGYITHAIGYAFMWTMLASLFLLGTALSMSLTERRAT